MFRVFIGAPIQAIPQGNLLDDLGGLSTNRTPTQPIISNGTGMHFEVPCNEKTQGYRISGLFYFSDEKCTQISGYKCLIIN